MAKRVITFGTFDLFHYGHLRLIQRAREFGDELIVGISSDELNYRKKRRYPIVCEEHRRGIIEALRCVDMAFIEESLELKQHYIETYKADVLVMGDDWAGVFDDMKCEVIYLPRTPSVSTTDIIEIVRTSVRGGGDKYPSCQLEIKLCA